MACRRRGGEGVTVGLGTSAIARRVRAFVNDTRAGATAIASAALTVMTVGAAALITDHVWLYDQRDVLKTAAEAASIAATVDIDRQLASNPRISDEDLEAALQQVAERYVLLNLLYLPIERLVQARDTLEVTLDLNRAQRTVGVTARANLGGTLFSRNLPLLGNYEGPEKVAASAGVESESTPVEVVLALDVSGSMIDNMKGQWTADREKTRLAIVQRAAKELVAILDPNGYNRVAVGIVPWYAAVRLDATAAARWVDKGWAAHPDTDPPPPAWQGCFNSHHRIYAGIPGAPARTAAALLELPADAPFVQATCRKHSARWGLDLINPQFMPTLFPLSTNRADIENSLDALVPTAAGTNSSLGALWAQRMLEPAWKRVWGGSGIHPVDPSTPEHAKLRKAIVLLTDGVDNQIGGVSRREVCDMAKEQKTEIFVIAALPDTLSAQRAKPGLRACSSEADDEKFYPEGTRRPGTTYVFLNNATPEALQAAFTDIANQLRTLRKVS